MLNGKRPPRAGDSFEIELPFNVCAQQITFGFLQAAIVGVTPLVHPKLSVEEAVGGTVVHAQVASARSAAAGPSASAPLFVKIASA
jgi:hypothetical protein